MRHHDINRALTRTLFLLESQTLFHNIVIKKDLAPSLPLVLSDIQQLYHLFMNIILNAAQAMEGKGTLSVKSYLLPGGEQVCVAISDTGPGISKAHLSHIFEPFFTTKDEGKGTGLGLSLAYRIIQNHGGHIRAESTPGKETTFSIVLPIGLKEKEGGESGNKT
jgi:signal transduction histidine kinase